jgi:hypothetical protein
MGPDTIDPELRKQLARGPATEPLEATVTLDAGPDQAYLPSEEVEPKVKDLLREVGREVGEDYDDVTIFENLGSFALRARPAFLKALLKRPEVTVATANRQSQDLLIRPVSKGSKRKR